MTALEHHPRHDLDTLLTHGVRPSSPGKTLLTEYRVRPRRHKRRAQPARAVAPQPAGSADPRRATNDDGGDDDDGRDDLVALRTTADSKVIRIYTIRSTAGTYEPPVLRYISGPDGM